MFPPLNSVPEDVIALGIYHVIVNPNKSDADDVVTRMTVQHENNTLKCLHCGLPHCADDPNCLERRRQIQILNIMTKDQLPFQEVQKKIPKQCSYSTILRQETSVTTAQASTTSSLTQSASLFSPPAQRDSSMKHVSGLPTEHFNNNSTTKRSRLALSPHQSSHSINPKESCFTNLGALVRPLRPTRTITTPPASPCATTSNHVNSPKVLRSPIFQSTKSRLQPPLQDLPSKALLINELEKILQHILTDQPLTPEICESIIRKVGDLL